MKPTHQSSIEINRVEPSNLNEDKRKRNRLVDLTLIQKPSCAATGFLGARKAYDNGTEDVRKFLSNECDLIYECRVCRNIFRSLTNFVSHKRVYCKTAFNANNHFHFNNDGFNDQNTSCIVQAAQENCNDHQQINSSDLNLQDSNEQININTDKNIPDVERTFHNSDGGCSLKSSELSSNKSTNQTNSETDSENVVQQSIQTSCIQGEKNVMQDVLTNNDSAVRQDLKVISVTPLDNPVSSAHVTCNICSEQFVTQKNLKIHITKKHVPSTNAYHNSSSNRPKKSFQSTAVFKHLSINHKEAHKRIRQMRDTICKTVKRPDEKILKLPPSDYEQEKLDATISNNEGTVDVKRWLNVKAVKAFKRKADEAKSKTETLVNKTKPRSPNELDAHNQVEAVNKRKRKFSSVFQNEDAEVNDDDKSKEHLSSPQQPDTKITIWPPCKNDIDNQTIKSEDTDLKNKKFNSREKSKEEKNQVPDMNLNEDKEKPNKKIDSDTVEPIKHIPCALCAKKFSSKTNLKRHVAMFHFRQNRFACKLCEYRGYRRIDTISHLSNLHSIQGEKETYNNYIELIVKADDDKRPPIKTDQGYDTNVTFSSVVASIAEDETIPNKLEEKCVFDTKLSAKRRNLLQLLENDEMLKTELESKSQEKKKTDNKKLMQPTGRTSSSSSEPENKRPTRNRVKPVRKDFVYNLNTIIKQEAEMHREQQLQQQAVLPLRSQRRRNTICDVKDSGPKTRSSGSELNKKVTSQKLYCSIPFEEVTGAAYKMAKNEVMNQRACFNRPPPELSELQSMPIKLTPPRLDTEILAIKEKKNYTKSKEVKRTLSFTDTLLLQTDATRGKQLLEAASKTTVEPIIQFPPTKPPFSLAEFTGQLSDTSSSSSLSSLAATSSTSAINSSSNTRRCTKAIKKQELSSKEQSQIEMLQRFRKQQNLSMIQPKSESGR